MKQLNNPFIWPNSEIDAIYGIDAIELKREFINL